MGINNIWLFFFVVFFFILVIMLYFEFNFFFVMQKKIWFNLGRLLNKCFCIYDFLVFFCFLLLVKFELCCLVILILLCQFWCIMILNWSWKVWEWLFFRLFDLVNFFFCLYCDQNYKILGYFLCLCCVCVFRFYLSVKKCC